MSPAMAAAHHRLRRPRRRPPPLQPQGSPLAALLLLAVLLLFLTTTAASTDDIGGGGGALVQPAAAPAAPEEASPPPVPVPAQRRAPSRHRAPREGQQHEYNGEEPLLIVGTVDGRVHAVGSEGDVVWSFDSGAPLVSSYYAGWEEGDYTGSSNVPVVIPAVDGSLLVHTPGKGVQRLPLSAAQLVERAPFLAGDGTLYTGARTSEALMVDLASGKVLQRFSGPSADKIAHMVDPRLHNQQQQPPQQNDSGADNSKAPAPSPSGGARQSPRQLLWLGRVEYSLRALDPATGHELWNLTVSELSPLFPGVPSGSSGSGAAAAVQGGGSGGNLPAGEGVGKGGKGGKGDTTKGALPPGRTGAGGSTSKALLDVLGPGPGWGGAGALLATPDGGLHRRDPTTGRVRLLAPLGAAPVSAFVVAPGGGGAGAGGNLLAAGGGSGVPVPLVHTLTREAEEEGDSDASSAASSEKDDEDLDSMGEGWDDESWGDEDGEGPEEQKPSKPLWLPAAGGGILGGSSPTVSIGQLGNGRLFGIVLDPLDGLGGRGGGASVLPHYLQHRHPGGVPGGEGLPSPSPSPPSEGASTTIPAGGPRPPKPGSAAAPGGPATGSLPRIHSHAQRDCPAGYPTSLCSLRRTGSGSVSGASGRPTTSGGKPPAPAPSAPALEDEDEDEEDGDEDEQAEPTSCRPGDPGFPGCLLGVHHLKALEAPPPAPSSSSSSSSGRLPSGTPGSGLLDMCMPPLLDPPSSSSSSSSDGGFDWTRPATWSGRAKRDALLLLTLVLGAIIMTVLGGTGTGVDSLWGGSGGIKASGQQQQSLVPSPSRSGAPVVDAEGNVRVGRLMLSPLVLGYGCHGTIVYRGLLDGRPVAVKRMLRAFHAAADREMRLLIESDGHPNVVRYFLREQAGDFVYLALELCVCSLRDVVARLEIWVRRRQLELLQQPEGDEEENMAGKKKKKKRPPRERVFIGGLLPPPASWAADGDATASNSSGGGAAPPQVRAALQQIASGVAHLHSLRIVHRDIKPHNILLSSSASSAASASTAADDGSSSGGALVLEEVEQLSGYVCKISDMGVGKLLAMGQSSFGASSFSAGINHPHSQHQLALQQQLEQQQAANGGADSSSAGSSSSRDNSSSSVPHGPGSVGWQAPEVMMGRLALLGNDADPLGASNASTANFAASSSSSRRTQAVDIFSLGCVFYTVLVPGGHPFGQWYERERNILTGEPDLSPLEASPDAHDLIQAMLQKDPARRPTARMVLGHPFFWDDERRLAFLVDFSDRLELEPADSLLVLAVEAGGADIVGRAGWDRRLHKALLEDGSRYRKYDTASVRDCLRLLRNKRNHFHELPKDVQRLMAPLPGGLYRYFQARFPRLLMHCHGVCVRLLTRDKIFRTYIGGKEIEDDYEEDNASLAALEPPVVARREQEGPGDAVEGKGEEEAAAAVASGVDGIGEESASAAPAPTAAAAPAIPKGDEELLARVTVFAGGTLATSYGCRGWWRPADHWARRLDAGKAKARPPHLTRQLTDGRFRTRLCQHWETSADPFGPSAPADGTPAVPACPMRRKGKCDFAHAPVELRVKETRRGRWGTTLDPPGPPSLRSSGGEDAIAQARVAERSRAATVMSSPGPGGGGRGMGGSGGGQQGGGGGGRRPSSSGQGHIQQPLMQQHQQPPPMPGMGGMGMSGGVDAPSWRRAPPQQQAGFGGGGGGYNGGGYHPPPGPP